MTPQIERQNYLELKHEIQRMRRNTKKHYDEKCKEIEDLNKK